MKDSQNNLDLGSQDSSHDLISISVPDLLARAKEQILSYHDLTVFSRWTPQERFIAGLAVASFAYLSFSYLPFSFRESLVEYNKLLASIYDDFCGPVKTCEIGLA